MGRLGHQCIPHGWKYCPDEEGIETVVEFRVGCGVAVGWKYCPDEEGIETKLSTVRAGILYE